MRKRLHFAAPDSMILRIEGARAKLFPGQRVSASRVIRAALLKGLADIEQPDPTVKLVA